MIQGQEGPSDAPSRQMALENVRTLQDLETLQAIAQDKLVILLFKAPWCDSCTALYPKIREFSDQRRYGITLLLSTPDSEIADRYHISKLPTLLFFHKGKLLQIYQGTNMTTIQNIGNKLMSEIKAKKPYKEEYPRHPGSREDEKILVRRPKPRRDRSSHMSSDSLNTVYGIKRAKNPKPRTEGQGFSESEKFKSRKQSSVGSMSGADSRSRTESRRQLRNQELKKRRENVMKRFEELRNNSRYYAYHGNGKYSTDRDSKSCTKKT